MAPRRVSPRDRREHRGVQFLRNISAGFIFSGVVRPLEPTPPEYVTLSMRSASDREFVALAQWNMLWEAAQFWRRFFDLDDLPGADGGDRRSWRRQRQLRAADTGAVLRVRAAVSSAAQSGVLDLFGLPLLRGGQWLFMTGWADIDNFLPPDFEARLACAWALTVWPHLISVRR